MSDIRHLAQRVLDLDKQATPGPWETDGVYDLYVFRKPRGNGVMVADRNVEYDDEAPAGSLVRARGTGAGLTEAQQAVNMRLVAEYRTAAPALARALIASLDENARLRAALAEIERRIREEAAPLAAIAQESNSREAARAWKSVYSSAIHAQLALTPTPTEGT